MCRCIMVASGYPLNRDFFHCSLIEESRNLNRLGILLLTYWLVLALNIYAHKIPFLFFGKIKIIRIEVCIKSIHNPVEERGVKMLICCAKVHKFY